MSQKIHINITLDENILQDLDMERGQLPRSTFLNDILTKIFSQKRQVFDWGEENLKAEEDIKKGKVKKFATKDSALKWLKS